MKTLWNVAVTTLALNFLLVAGAVGWLYQSGHLDRARALAVKAALFAPPSAPDGTVASAKAAPTTQPLLGLDALLEKHAGQRAGEQVEAIQQTIDAQTAQLDRRKRELDDLQSQVYAEQEKLHQASTSLEGERRQLAERERQADSAAGDKGFQDSLKLYSAMPAVQAKRMFMTLPEDTVVNYLQAMPPRAATKIVKEFKTKEELDRVHAILEKMRQGQPAPAEPPTTRESKDAL